MRLTNKNSDYYKFRYDMFLRKLSDLEDIEEKYPVDLLTILKAAENGFYQNELIFQHRRKHLDSKFIRINLWDECLEFYDMWNGGNRYEFYFKDYGKTWALTEEELEND